MEHFFNNMTMQRRAKARKEKKRRRSYAYQP